MVSVENKLLKHEVECEKRYGKIQAELATVVTNQTWSARLIWFVFTILTAFELNALFKFIGH